MEERHEDVFETERLSFPNMFVLEIGRPGVDDADPIKSCDPQGPGLLCPCDLPSLMGLV